MDDVPVDAVAPWTIKAVGTETRNRVIAAARQEGLTVGQWLERRVNEWIADGGPVRVSHGPPRSETRADHGQDGGARATPGGLRELAGAYGELRRAEAPAPLLGRLETLIREQIKAQRAPSTPRNSSKALPAPSDPGN